MTGRTISTLLGKSKVNLLKISDYAKIEYIFGLYIRGHYDTMAKEIYLYKTFDFFIDFALYLHSNFNSKEYHKLFYEHAWDEYAMREDTVYNELNFGKYIKKQKRKYML